MLFSDPFLHLSSLHNLISNNPSDFFRSISFCRLRKMKETTNKKQNWEKSSLPACLKQSCCFEMSQVILCFLRASRCQISVSFFFYLPSSSTDYQSRHVCRVQVSSYNTCSSVTEGREAERRSRSPPELLTPRPLRRAVIEQFNNSHLALKNASYLAAASHMCSRR